MGQVSSAGGESIPAKRADACATTRSTATVSVAGVDLGQELVQALPRLGLFRARQEHRVILAFVNGSGHGAIGLHPEGIGKDV